MSTITTTHQDQEAITRYLGRLHTPTADSARYDLAAWQRWLSRRGTSLLQAQRQDIEEYLVSRRDQGLRPRSVGSILSRIRGLYRWAAQEGLTATDPTSLVRAPARGRSDRVWLGWQDLHQLLEASTHWRDGLLAAHIHLWALAGLRPGEPRRLQAQDLIHHEGRPALRVRATKTAGMETLLLSPSTAQVLGQAASGRRSGHLLVNPRTGRPWTKPAERHQLVQLLDHTHLPPVTPYGLRVSFITLALEAGIPERDVMISARHSSSAQTARYDRLRHQVTASVGPLLEEAIRSRQDQP